MGWVWRWAGSEGGGGLGLRGEEVEWVLWKGYVGWV